MKLRKLTRGSTLLIAAASLLDPGKSQGQILINGSATISCLPMSSGGYLSPAHLSLQTGTATQWAYSGPGLSLAPDGNVINFSGGSGYLLQSPATTTTTANNYGDITIYAINNGQKIAEKNVSIYPMDVEVPSSMTYPAGAILDGKTFTAGGNKWINNATGYIWGITYGQENYDIGSPINNFAFVITPKIWAPLNENVVVKMFFGPTCSALNTNNYTFASANDFLPWGTATAQRDPFVTSSGPGYICNGASILSVNVADHPLAGAFTPCGPAPGGVNNKLRHFTYQWYVGSSPIAGATGRTYNAGTAGSYYCKVKQYKQVYDAATSSYKWGCSAEVEENSNIVTINPPIDLNITTTPMPPNTNVSASATGGTPPYSYSADNQVTWVSRGSFIEPANSSVIIYVKDAMGCIVGQSVLTRPTEISNAQKIADKIRVYPNPVSTDMLHIYGAQSFHNALLTIIDISGRVVYKEEKKEQGANGPWTVNVGSLQPGVYFLKLNADGGHKSVERFVIAR